VGVRESDRTTPQQREPLREVRLDRLRARTIGGCDRVRAGRPRGARSDARRGCAGPEPSRNDPEQPVPRYAVVKHLADSPIDQRYGANLALARSTPMAIGGMAIVVPADDAVCLWVPVDDGYGGTCASTAVALAGKLLVQLLAGQDSTVVAFVPDGTEAPVVGTSGGDSVTVPVRNNIAATHVGSAATLKVGATDTPLTDR
jgi:hypothetical protein